MNYDARLVQNEGNRRSPNIGICIEEGSATSGAPVGLSLHLGTRKFHPYLPQGGSRRKVLVEETPVRLWP